jgi:hypothetical protein
MPAGPASQLPADALAFALASAAAFAALDLSQKWTARYAVATPAAFLALRLLAGAVMAPLLLLIPGALDRAQHLSALPWAALAGLVLVNLAGNVLYLWSLYRADVSVVGSLWPVKNFYLPFLAFLLPPHERFPPVVYALIGVATLGALGVAYNKRLGIAALLERPVWLMILVTVPVFAVSDLLFGTVSAAIGGAFATAVVAWGLALLGLPLLFAERRTRKAVVEGLKRPRGAFGAALTGLFLVTGVACIGEAFKRAGGGVVLVNVYAMTSGLLLLAANAARPGWLDREERSVYLVRFAGALTLISAAALLLLRARG